MACKHEKKSRQKAKQRSRSVKKYGDTKKQNDEVKKNETVTVMTDDAHRNKDDELSLNITTTITTTTTSTTRSNNKSSNRSSFSWIADDTNKVNDNKNTARKQKRKHASTIPLHKIHLSRQHYFEDGKKSE